VQRLAAERGIEAARVTAIGAIEDPEIGVYNLDTKSYDRKVFPGIWELLSLNGNLALLDGKPFLHAHVAIAGDDYSVKGGHLFDALVGVIVEMFVDPYPTPLPRLACEEIGMPRWEPGG